MDISVVVPIYNQAKYLRQALESILSQECSCSYEILLGNDFSSDESGIICTEYKNKYPNIIKYFNNEENVGLLKNYKMLLIEAKGEYIAILEGDDYWTDNKKLQKQITFLEQNPDYGLVHSDCDYLYDEHNAIVNSYNKAKGVKVSSGFVLTKLIEYCFIKPLTAIFRKDLYDKYINIDEYIKENFITLDYPLWLDLSHKTKFYYMPESTGVYRIHINSVSNNSETFQNRKKFLDSTLKTQKYFIKKYDIQDANINLIEDTYARYLCYSGLFLDNKGIAKKYIKRIHKKNISDHFFYLVINTPLNKIPGKYFKMIYYKYFLNAKHVE